MIGCHLVEIETRDDLDRALAEPAAMVVLLGKLEHLGGLRLEEIAAVAKPRGIPIMVDAASERWSARARGLCAAPISSSIAAASSYAARRPAGCCSARSNWCRPAWSQRVRRTRRWAAR